VLERGVRLFEQADRGELGTKEITVKVHRGAYAEDAGRLVGGPGENAERLSIRHAKT